MQHNAIALNSMVYYTNVTQFYGYTHKCHSTQFNGILYTNVTQFDGILHINVTKFYGILYTLFDITQTKVTQVGIYMTASQHNGTQAKIAQINIYDGTESY